MQTFSQLFDRVDALITGWMARSGITFTRIALGVVYLWFGALKFFPGLSPAEDLATRTIETLSFGLMQPAVSRPFLAAWETAIGLGLLSGKFLRLTLLLLFLQIPGTVMPVFLYPGEVFQHVPYAPTLEGQYIVKNLVIVGAALVVGATVRGGRLTTTPRREERHAPAPNTEAHRAGERRAR